MQITLLGSGSKGNCAIVSDGKQFIMIDAGFSGVEIERRLTQCGLNKTQITALLITHEHDDHIKSVRLLGDEWKIPVITNNATAEVLKIREQNPRRFVKFTTGQSFLLGSIKVTSFAIPHDAADPVGYTFELGTEKIVMATDLGSGNEQVFKYLRDANILVLESNYHPELLEASNRPQKLKQRISSAIGHLSNFENSTILKNVVTERTKKVVLAHLSRECNHADVVYKQATQTLKQLGREEIEVIVASQDQVVGPIKIS